MDRARATNAALTTPRAQGLWSAIWTLAPRSPATPPTTAQGERAPRDVGERKGEALRPATGGSPSGDEDGRQDRHHRKDARGEAEQQPEAEEGEDAPPESVRREAPGDAVRFGERGAGGRKAARSGRGVRAAGRGAGPGSVEPHRESLPDGRVAEPFVRAALVDHVQDEGPRRRDRVREPHGRRCLETVDLDMAEVGVLLHLPGRQIDPGNRGPRGRTLREMHLHPLGVEVVAGLDAPAQDGETRFRRRRLHPEREVRMEEFRLVAPGVDELLKEAGGGFGFGLGVGGGGFRRRARPAEGRFGPEAGKGR